MQNGYMMPSTPESMTEIGKKISEDECLKENIFLAGRVGVQWHTEVSSGDHCVTQVFCSAVPITYAQTVRGTKPKDWKPLAEIILESAYQATLLTGAIMAARLGKRVSVYLIQLGGGAFGNPGPWICAAMEKALLANLDKPLDVKLVNYGRPPSENFIKLEQIGCSQADRRSTLITGVINHATASSHTGIKTYFLAVIPIFLAILVMLSKTGKVGPSYGAVKTSFQKLEGLVGDHNVKTILDHVSVGDFTKEEVEDLADHLHPKVRGAFIRAKGEVNFVFNEKTMKTMLTNWYEEEAFELTEEEAINKLIVALKESDKAYIAFELRQK